MSYPATEMELAETSRNFAATLAKFLLMDAIVEPFLGGASRNFGLLRHAGEMPKRNQPLLGYASICTYAAIIETTLPRGSTPWPSQKNSRGARAQPHTRPACREALRHPPSCEPLGARRGHAWDRHDEAHSRCHRRRWRTCWRCLSIIAKAAACTLRLTICGTDATGQKTDHYCKWCYDRGGYTYARPP